MKTRAWIDLAALGGGMSNTISVSAAARIAGCSPDTVLRWIEEGAVEAWRLPPRGWYKIDRDSLTRFLSRRESDTHTAKAWPAIPD